MMEPQKPEALLKEWRLGKFKPAYYFIGEGSRAAEAMGLLRAEFKASEFDASRWSQDIDAHVNAIVSDALTPPILGPRRLVLVETPRIPAQARARLVEYLADPLKTTTIAFLSDDRKPDPKDSLVKAVAAVGAVCHCAPLRDAEAQQRLREEAAKAGKDLAAEAAHVLVAEVGSDWALLVQELEKAILYAGAQKIVTREHVLGCLGYQKALDPFALPRMIQKKDRVASLRYLRRLFEQGKPDEQAFRALSQISSAVTRQYKAKRLLEAGRSADEIFRALRLNAYYDQDFLSDLKRWGANEPAKALRECLRAETALKSSAWLDARIEVERLAARVCSGSVSAPGRPSPPRPPAGGRA